MNLLYTKYSNDRAPEYQIRTDVIKKDNGDKAVVKRPVSRKSKKHIDNLYKTYIDLGKCLEKTRFELNEILPFEDGYGFQFLSSITLEEKLDELISKGKYEEFKQLYLGFLDDVQKSATYKFELSQEYVDTFGEWKLQGDYNCLPITDIDILFANIFVQDNKWIIIDYEWTYNFLIPIKYVIFRTLHYYLSFGRENNIKEHMDMYKMAGISEEEKDYFLKCEENFQRSLMKGYNSLWSINDAMGSRTYYPFFMVEEKTDIDNSKKGRVVLYNGDDVVDKWEYKPNIDENNRCVYQFDFDTSKVDRAKIYPYKESCRMSMKGVLAVTDKRSEWISYSCNGQEIGNNVWALFNEPCIEVKDLPRETKAIYISYAIQKEVPRELMKTILWNEQYTNDIDDKKEEINRLKEQNQKYESKLLDEKEKVKEYVETLEQITSSRTWKIASLLTKGKSFLKKDNL